MLFMWYALSAGPDAECFKRGRVAQNASRFRNCKHVVDSAAKLVVCQRFAGLRVTTGMAHYQWGDV